MTDRERRMSELPPELQQMLGLIDAKVTQMENNRRGKAIWKRIGKIALIWAAVIGALNMIGMAFLLLDAVTKTK